jgi:hypothetical protein
VYASTHGVPNATLRRCRPCAGTASVPAAASPVNAAWLLLLLLAELQLPGAAAVGPPVSVAEVLRCATGLAAVAVAGVLRVRFSKRWNRHSVGVLSEVNGVVASAAPPCLSRAQRSSAVCEFWCNGRV